MAEDTLPVAELPAGDKWTCEIKFDGYRCIAVKRGREVTLFSRHNYLAQRDGLTA